MRRIGKTIGLGLLLIPVWFVTLFMLSFIYQSEQPIDFISANIISAVVLAAVSWRFARILKPANLREAVPIAGVWVGIVLVLLAIVAIGNGTQSIVFGRWAMYLGYLGIILGVGLAVAKRPRDSQTFRPPI